MAREMKTCENGHLYNPQAYERCPYCYGEDANKQVNVTMPAKEEEEEIGWKEGEREKRERERAMSSSRLIIFFIGDILFRLIYLIVPHLFEQIKHFRHVASAIFADFAREAARIPKIL